MLASNFCAQASHGSILVMFAPDVKTNACLANMHKLRSFPNWYLSCTDNFVFRDEAEETFAVLDKDGDGVISKEGKLGGFRIGSSSHKKSKG